jgi:hypothetical protein
MSAMFSELTEGDQAIMERQRSIVHDAASKYGGWPQDAGARANLLQVMVDSQVFRVDQTFELQALGVVLGDILCDEVPFQWVMITDEYGCDPTLRWKATSIHLNALTMISKRIERNERPIIREMLDWAHRVVSEREGSAADDL